MKSGQGTTATCADYNWFRESFSVCNSPACYWSRCRVVWRDRVVSRSGTSYRDRWSITDRWAGLVSARTWEVDAKFVLGGWSRDARLMAHENLGREARNSRNRWLGRDSCQDDAAAENARRKLRTLNFLVLCRDYKERIERSTTLENTRQR